MLTGIPKVPVSRVAGAIFYAATDADQKSSGSAWLLVDDGPVFMVPKEEFKQGVYKMIDDRANAVRAYVFCVSNHNYLPCDLLPSIVCTQILWVGICLPAISGASRATQSLPLAWERLWPRLLGITSMKYRSIFARLLPRGHNFVGPNAIMADRSNSSRALPW